MSNPDGFKEARKRRWSHRGEGWCGGETDPTAPHDLTLPSALTRNKRPTCRRCKQYNSHRARKKTEFGRRTLGLYNRELLERTAGEDEERGIPAFPTHLSKANLATIWQAQEREDGGAASWWREVIRALRKPWPGEDEPGPLPAAPEDWSDLPKVKPLPKAKHGEGMTNAECNVRKRARVDRREHRVALARMANDRSQSLYTRRLAFQALTTDDGLGARAKEKGDSE